FGCVLAKPAAGAASSSPPLSEEPRYFAMTQPLTGVSIWHQPAIPPSGLVDLAKPAAASDPHGPTTVTSAPSGTVPSTLPPGLVRTLSLCRLGSGITTVATLPGPPHELSATNGGPLSSPPVSLPALSPVSVAPPVPPPLPN